VYVFLPVSHGASHSRTPEDDEALASENGILTEVVPDDDVDIEPFNDGDVASCATVIAAAPDGTNGAVVFDNDDRALVFHKAAETAAAAAHRLGRRNVAVSAHRAQSVLRAEILATFILERWLRTLSWFFIRQTRAVCGGTPRHWCSIFWPFCMCLC